jgi:hypothetical protein
MMVVKPLGRQERIWIPFVVALFLILISARDVQGQAEVLAAFSADRGAPLIGEPIRLTLTVSVPVGAEVTLPTFRLDWPPFMVTSAGDVRKIRDNAARTTYQQELIVILWKPGDYETPETFVDYRLLNSTETVRLTVEPAFFAVPSVLDSNDFTLRPLKPPESLPYVSPLFIAAGFMALIVAIVSVGRWASRRLIPQKVEKPGDMTSRTLRELQRIGTMALPPCRAYPLVGDTLRKYVEEQFHIPAEEMTTDELLSVMQSQSRFNEQQRRDLRRILERVDLVKFAKVQPETDSTKRLLQAVTQWVEAVAPEKSEGKP